MKRKRHSPEEVINKLREAEILIKKGRPSPGQRDPEGCRVGKLLSPSKRRRAVGMACERRRVSQRRACRVLGQARTTQRYQKRTRVDEELLRALITELACAYGGYGIPRILQLLRDRGVEINRKRLERIWREEGLKVPQKQKKRRRLWLNDGSCIRLRPQYSNHVWSYDFIEDATRDGRKLRMLVVMDEFTRVTRDILRIR